MRTRQVPGVRLVAVSCAVPQNEISNTGANERAGRAVGVAQRRHVTAGTTFLDLAYRAAWESLQAAHWHASAPQALVVVTQSQERRIPSVACELHKRLGMDPDVPAFDVGLACSGYVYGLWIAGSLQLPRVLLVVGDTISRFLDPSDKATYPIFGDAVSATCLAHDFGPGVMNFIGGTDGHGAESLKTVSCLSGIIEPSHQETLHMNGQDVFDFAIQTVPPLVAETTMNGYCDWYLFHQANRMMLEHIVKKAKLPIERVPFNLMRYGNTSSSSIPLLMCDSECSESLREKKNRVAMFGFGAGYSYGGILMDVGPLPTNVVSV